MPKLFAYGCSFTDYRWSTWANILAKNLDHKLVQKGRQGCGNNFIHYRIKQDIESKSIRPQDKVRIMWCYPNRISKIIDYENFEPTPETFDPKKQKQNLIQSCNQIVEIEGLLLNNNIDYDFFCWLPDIKNEKLALYKPLKPSVYEIVFNNDWMSRLDRAIDLSGELVPKIIRKNITTKAKQKNLSFVEYIRSQPLDARLQVILDIHPTPLQHLEYLQAIYPEMDWKSNLIDEIHRENQEVLSKVW